MMLSYGQPIPLGVTLFVFWSCDPGRPSEQREDKGSSAHAGRDDKGPVVAASVPEDETAQPGHPCSYDPCGTPIMRPTFCSPKNSPTSGPRSAMKATLGKPHERDESVDGGCMCHSRQSQHCSRL